MWKRSGTPRFGELLICKVKKILPHTALVDLIEFDNKEGSIHISQISGKWVENISNFISVDEEIVCKVVKVNYSTIELSIKEVDKNAKNKKWNYWKDELKSENILKNITKKLGKNPEDMYKIIGDAVISEYGCLSLFMEDLRVNKETVFKEFNAPKEWQAYLLKMSEEKQKDIIIKKNVTLYTLESGGISLIKKTFDNIKNDALKIKYISAPKYSIAMTGKDYKTVEKELAGILEKIKEHCDKENILFNELK